jgi:SdrD B-like domain
MFKTVIACAIAVASVVASPAAAQDQDCGGEGSSIVCGFVWNDANNNGVQDPGESGIGGKLVTLSDGTDTIEAYTDDSGFFEFFGVDDGSYTLSIETSVIGGTAQPSAANVGSDDTIDSDGQANGTTSAFSFVKTGSDKVAYDFGFYTPSAQSLGTGTPGYWKNHPEAWPDTITVGDMTYDRDTAIYWLKRVGKDKTTTMFSSLVSAKLNVLMGNDSSCVDDVIAAADAWMKAYGPVGSGVTASSPEWGEGQPLHTTLDAYNNGRLCAPHRN